MTMLESAVALGFRFNAVSSSSCSLPPIGSCRVSSWNPEDPSVIGCCFRRVSHRFPSSGWTSQNASFWNGMLRRKSNGLHKNKIRSPRATPDEHSQPSEWSSSESKKASYHPFEELGENVLSPAEGDAQLTDAEIARTMIEGNSKATIMFSGTISEEVSEKIFCPELPYATDEHGDIYFEVHSHQDIIQTLTADSNFVQVFIGLDNIDKLNEIELSGSSAIDFDIDEIQDEDSDIDEDDDDDEEEGDDDDDEEEDEEEEEDDGDSDDEDWVSFLEDDEEEHLSSFEALGDWANLDTMRSTHPMYFAEKIAEVVSSPHLDRMEPPSTALSIQGLLRPAFIEEHAIVRRRMARKKSSDDDTDQTNKLEGSNAKHLGMSNGHAHGSGYGASSADNRVKAEDLDQNESNQNGTLFYKLEMIKIQLVSAYGKQECSEHYKISFMIVLPFLFFLMIYCLANFDVPCGKIVVVKYFILPLQDVVDIGDLRDARPDLIAHSSAKILSRLNVSGEKTLEALKALCWRMKGIQAEEVMLIGVDSLGFDLRVCSGTQVQTLRFAFSKQATSEFTAERQLHDLLFPRIQQSILQKQPEARSKDC